MTLELGALAQPYTKLSPAHARQLLTERRSEVTALGCWLTNRADSHDTGYKAVNLENTMTRVEGKAGKIGIKKAYMHHISLVGDDRYDQLTWVTRGSGGTFQVSHLCHNAGCFNPRHLIVEESWLNKARNTCQGHEILHYSGNGPMRYNPCAHGGQGGKAYIKCILPDRFITESGNYGPEHTV